jgi:hypothetical protein
VNRLRRAVGLVEIKRLIGELFAALKVCAAASFACAVDEHSDLFLGRRLRRSGGWSDRGLDGCETRCAAGRRSDDRRESTMHPLVDGES